MRKYAARLISAIFVIALVTGCTYTYDESTDDSSSTAEPLVRTDWTVQELLSPKGTVFGPTPTRPLPASGPCSYKEAVVSSSAVEHAFPVTMFGGMGTGLIKAHSEMGIVFVYRTHVFNQLKWETPEARSTSAQLIEITEESLDSLLQRDSSLRKLLEQFDSMGLPMHPPYYLVDNACLTGPRDSIPRSW